MQIENILIAAAVVYGILILLSIIDKLRAKLIGRRDAAIAEFLANRSKQK